MNKKLSELKFNMNKKMADYIINIMIIKEKMNSLDQNSEEYKKLKIQFNKRREEFIKEFQLINKREIETYLELND